MDGSVVFTRLRQCSLPCGHIGATWRIRLNLCFLWPTRVHNQNNKSISSAISAQLTAESPYALQCATSFPQNCPLIMGDLDPIKFMILWASSSPQSTQHHDRFSCFRTGGDRVSYTLQWAAPSPSKLPLPIGGSGPQSNTWFPGPT